MSLALNTFDLHPEQVRERFDWAVRQGRPRWLWPDLDVADWQDALEQIAAITSQVLRGGRAADALEGDARALGIAGYTSGIGPLVGLWLRQGRVTASAEVRSVFEFHLEHNRARMEALRGHATAIAEQFDAAGIAATILKGMHTAFVYFPEPAARPLSDIDILIDGPNSDAATELLRGLAFRPEVGAWRKIGTPVQPRSLCFVHADDPWSIDLHLSLNRRYSAGSPMLRLDDARTAGDTAGWPVSAKARVLAQPMLLLHLALHASCGLMSLTLLRLVELVLVIRKDSEAGLLSWDAFLAAAERAGALGSIYPALMLAEQLVPATVPQPVIYTLAQHVPRRVRRVVDRLTPASAHSLARCSLEERFMWTPSIPKALGQILQEIVPPGAVSLPRLLQIYQTRAWRLARGTLTR